MAAHGEQALGIHKCKRYTWRNLACTTITVTVTIQISIGTLVASETATGRERYVVIFALGSAHARAVQANVAEDALVCALVGHDGMQQHHRLQCHHVVGAAVDERKQTRQRRRLQSRANIQRQAPLLCRHTHAITPKRRPHTEQKKHNDKMNDTAAYNRLKECQ